MPLRAVGSATISFGLVSIPIKMFSTSVSSAGVHFNMLHKKCGTRLKQQYVCPTDNEVVAREDIVKGYEFSKDQYVTFADEELKALQEKASETLEITEFVPADKVPPLYFDTAYYLGPDKGGDRAYKLLVQAMRTTGRSALAKWAARGKMYLVLIRPYEEGEGLILYQLHYADELRPFSEVPVGEATIKEGELKLATQIVEQIASDSFRPEAYEDEVKKRTEEAIQRKIEGQEVTAAPAEAPQAQIIDLMEALKASIGHKPAPPAPREKPVLRAVPSGDDERKPAKRAGRDAKTERATGTRGQSNRSGKS